MVPVAPTAGALHAAPKLTDWNVVLGGVTKSSVVPLVVVVPPFF
jgi:hypothetical protein